MPRLVAILITLSVAVGVARAQEAQPPPKPVLVADQAEINVGEVVEGDEPRFVFTVTNTSDRAIKLKVIPFCGCTVAKFDPELAAGAKGTIEATLHTRSMKGKTVKVIAVRPEDDAKSKIDLRVLADVRPLVRVEPATARYVIVKDRVPNHVEFTLTPEPGKGVEFREVVSSSPYVLARLVPAAGGATKVDVSITPDAPPGHLQSNLAVVTSSPAVPRIGLIVTGEKGIAVSPRVVYWGGISETSVAAREEVTLVKRGGRFAVRGVTATDPAIRAAVETVTEGSQYRVVVTYAGGWKAGRQQSALRISTDDPAQPEIVVSVQAIVNPAPAAATTTAPTAGG